MRSPWRKWLIVLGLGLAAACRHASPSSPVSAPPLLPITFKILVSADGFYRLPLAEEPFPPDGADQSGANISLTTAGEPVPFLLLENSLIFYGLASANRYTKYRPYLLIWGDENKTQPRIPHVPAALPPVPSLTQATRTLRFTENVLYKSGARSASAAIEPWFWHTIQVGQTLNLPLTLPPVADGRGRLRLQVWGASTHPDLPLDHDLDVHVNGKTIGTIRWDGQRYTAADLALPPGSLQTGSNLLTLDNSAPGATVLDISLLDWVEISYAAPMLAVDDWFDAHLETAALLNLTGFTAPPLVFDITAPRHPKQLAGKTAANGTVQVSAAVGAHIAAVGPGGWRQPAAITPLRASPWRNPQNQADMIIITTDALLPALAPLAAARQNQGLQVAQLTVDEIYDQFGAGLASPESIRAFLAYAMTEWEPPAPRYLLLVGEATYDYRHYLGPPPANLVPPLLIPVAFGGETISDIRLADVDEDGQPDLAVGRWPVADTVAAAGLVQRTLAYEQGTATGQAVFVTDSGEFAHFVNQVIDRSHFAPPHLSRLNEAGPGQVAQAWNQGAWLVTYAGHGSLTLWGQEEILSLDAIASLKSPTPPPLVLQFTCLTGYFAHPVQASLSEALLRHADGPVLLVAPTSLTLAANQEAFATSLLAALQDPNVARIGDATQQARANLNLGFDSLREISDTFALLGDPATRIVRPPAAEP